MMNKDQLEQLAALKRLTIENCEKDYFQDLLLLNLYKIVGKEFVFKGGTCLYKIYKLNRFSEDLDFTVTKKINIERIMQMVLYSIKSLNIGVAIKQLDKFQNQINIRLAFRGPLYKGTKESVLILLLNLSSREKPALAPERKTLSPFYNDLPVFEVFAMPENEILIEKINTVLERNKPRDVYDLWFLLKIKELKADEGLLARKIGKFNKEQFMLKVEEKGQNWEKELKRFIIGTLPPFAQIKKEIEERL